MAARASRVAELERHRAVEERIVCRKDLAHGFGLGAAKAKLSDHLRIVEAFRLGGWEAGLLASGAVSLSAQRLLQSIQNRRCACRDAAWLSFRRPCVKSSSWLDLGQAAASSAGGFIPMRQIACHRQPASPILYQTSLETVGA